MNCCKSNCTCLAIIIAIIAGVILGVLYSLGFVSTGIIFWVYAVIGVLALLLTPLYARTTTENRRERCFCPYRRFILTAAIGTVIASVVGLIVAGIAGTVVTAIITGVSTFFLTMLLVSIVCLTGCICSDD